MKLNVYEGKSVAKTYEADTYDLMFGVLEDVADAVRLDDLKTGSDVEIITLVGNLVIKSKDTVKNLVKDIFDGLTDDELKRTKVTELAAVIIDVVKYTVEQLCSGLASKN